MTTSPDIMPRRHPGRLLWVTGLALAALGIGAYAVQIGTQRLMAPWYVPCAATLGAVLVAVALWRKRSVWRVFALLGVTLLAGAEWAFLLRARSPAYNGPVAEGRPFPAFATARADGSPFTQSDLEGEQNNVLVFFRGRW